MSHQNDIPVQLPFDVFIIFSLFVSITILALYASLCIQKYFHTETLSYLLEMGKKEESFISLTFDGRSHVCVSARFLFNFARKPSKYVNDINDNHDTSFRIYIQNLYASVSIINTEYGDEEFLYVQTRRCFCEKVRKSFGLNFGAVSIFEWKWKSWKRTK